MPKYPVRPQTPQPLLHRLPDKPAQSDATKPSKYIILIIASTNVAGKVQIAQSVSDALSCPLFQGDSLHETSARAASVGVVRTGDNATTRPNESRYQRMWLSKLTRTGYLFPEESRAANDEFSGFGGTSSTSTSRRGSASSVASDSSDAVSISSSTKSLSSSPLEMKKVYINKPPILSLSKKDKMRKENRALMVMTHPQLEEWHKNSIRMVVGDYGIGVIFVPLDDGEGLPMLDPKTMSTFPSLNMADEGANGEVLLRVDVKARVSDMVEDIVIGIREMME